MYTFKKYYLTSKMFKDPNLETRDIYKAYTTSNYDQYIQKVLPALRNEYKSDLNS